MAHEVTDELITHMPRLRYIYAAAAVHLRDVCGHGATGNLK